MYIYICVGLNFDDKFLFVSNRKVESTRLLREMKIESRRAMSILLLATLKLHIDFDCFKTSFLVFMVAYLIQ